MRQPLAEMAVAAVDRLVLRLPTAAAGAAVETSTAPPAADAAASHLVLAHELVERGSTAPPHH